MSLNRASCTQRAPANHWLIGCICHAEQLINSFKPEQEKTAQCVGSVEDQGRRLQVKTRRVVAATSSCLRRGVQWFHAGDAGWRLCRLRPSAALGSVYFQKQLNHHSTALPLKISSWFGGLAAAHFLKKYFESWLEEPLGSNYFFFFPIIDRFLFTQSAKSGPVRCQFHSAPSLPFKWKIWRWR